MFEPRRLVRFAAVAAAFALATVGCGGLSPASTGSGQATPAPAGPATTATGLGATEGAAQTATAVDATALPSGARLIALADGEAGGRYLWALGSDLRWSMVGAIPGATALGRTADGVAVATKAGIEARSRADLSHAQRVAALPWPGPAPTLPIVDLDYSAAGKTALVAADGATMRYATSRADGTLEYLSPAPTDSFTPAIRWLDESRVLVLSNDTLQASRLTVIEPAAHTLTVVRALSGVRVFAVSRDREVAAVATEAAIYVEPISTFDDISTPPPSVTLAELQVVWALALDQDGSRLFTLSATLASDGSVGTVHELMFARRAATWQRVLDSSVPFGRAVAQVYLP